MNSRNLEDHLNDLKQQIAKLGMPIPGSIQTMYLRCGKKNCRCHQSDDQRHGPYYLWYRRKNGKLTTQSIAEEDLQSYRIWISNREELERVIQKMIDLGAAYASNFKLIPGKSKNPLPRMRGK
jgi:hypothetical protein